MGNLEADFGFTGMFWAAETGLAVARFRSYDPELGRWLSRDPLDDAEVTEGPNLYAYVAANPVNLTDPLGLSGCCEQEALELKVLEARANRVCKQAIEEYHKGCRAANNIAKCQIIWEAKFAKCRDALQVASEVNYYDCLKKPCRQKRYCPRPNPEPLPPFPLPPDPDVRKAQEEESRRIRERHENF